MAEALSSETLPAAGGRSGVIVAIYTFTLVLKGERMCQLLLLTSVNAIASDCT
jgi:hypothetical protein